MCIFLNAEELYFERYFFYLWSYRLRSNYVGRLSKDLWFKTMIVSFQSRRRLERIMVATAYLCHMLSKTKLCLFILLDKLDFEPEVETASLSQIFQTAKLNVVI